MELSLTRKAFLKLLMALGIASAAPGLAACGGGSGGNGGANQSTTGAFRLSRRGQSACTACRQHAANKLFATAAAAASNRAHLGCDCRIKPIRISSADFKRFFAADPVYDRRLKA